MFDQKVKTQAVRYTSTTQYSFTGTKGTALILAQAGKRQISISSPYSYTMNAPEGEVKFVPKQALAPSPQLYDELVSDCMDNLAKASLALITPITAGSVVHDNGCGTGAASAAVVMCVRGQPSDISIKDTDTNEESLNVYRNHAAEGG